PNGSGPDAATYTQGAAPSNGAHGVTGGRGFYMSGPPTETRLGSGINGGGACQQDRSVLFRPRATVFPPRRGVHTGGARRQGGLGGHGGHGGWGGGCGLGGCSTPVYGTGIPYGMNPCYYDSYLRH